MHLLRLVRTLRAGGGRVSYSPGNSDLKAWMREIRIERYQTELSQFLRNQIEYLNQKKGSL